jgi:cyclophilin family peptidyl-prolyl cis-trans isomerase
VIDRNVIGLPIVLALLATGCSVDTGGGEEQMAEDSTSTYSVADDPLPQVVLETTMGTIVIELNREAAPKTVANFLVHVQGMRNAQGKIVPFYEGMFFYRILGRPAVIQVGLLDTTYARRLSPVAFLDNEGDNGLKNVRGAVTMARATDPNSAKSEFFINVEDNPELDTTEDKWGYAVFGKVIEGMDVADAIHDLPTRTRGTRDFMPEEPLPAILRCYVRPKTPEQMAELTDTATATEQ